MALANIVEVVVPSPAYKFVLCDTLLNKAAPISFVLSAYKKNIYEYMDRSIYKYIIIQNEYFLQQ